MELEHDQRVEMIEKMRELRRTGNSLQAMNIQVALGEDRFYLGDEPEPTPDTPKQPGKAAQKSAWQKFAKAVSDFDEEVIMDVSRGDLIKMLKANGLIE